MSTRDIYAGVVATNNTSTSSPSSEDNPTTVHFSSHVDQALQELLPSNDVFDSPHFDAVDYINQLFPNEQALNDNLDTFILKVKRKIVRVDEEIITAVRRQSSAGAQASRDLEEAKNVIYNLYSKIQDIKGKAEQSEAMVQKITKDIKELDYGKKHITTTISALEGLHELVTAIDALKELKIKQDYKQVAKKLQVVNSLVTKFEKYQDIAKILRLIGEVNTIKLELKEQILKDFQSWERHDQEGTSVTKLLSAACEVVDALGNEARQKLISQFTNQQITLYKMIFSQKKKAAFDNILKRYNWMRKLLAKYEDKYADIFPEDWCVRQELVVEFCLATRDDIVNLLNANKGCMDPTVLYRSILNTTQFEREMHDRFHVSSQEEIKMETQQAQVKVTEELEQLVPQEKTADAIKRKFKLLLRQRQIEQQMKRVAVEDLPDRAPKKAVKPQKDYKFLGFISSCFDDHMDTYINYESKELTAALEGYCKKEEWSEDGETKSHESLFMYISSSIKSCTALSKGKVLLSLIENVWKKHLNKYAAFISDSLPRIQSLGTVQAKDSFMEKMDMRKWIPNTENNNNTTDKQLIVNFTEDEENKVCYMIHIATFCLDNIETMQDDLRALMEEPYASQVDLSEETNKFYVVLKSAVEQLVLNLMITVEAEFKKMTLLPLATVTEVGDQSEYVSSMISFLSDAFPYLAGKIPLNNFKYLCDSFVLSLFHSYMTNIYKCKKINGTGAQQLLLDVTSLTTFLKFIINLGDSTRFDEEELHTFAKKVQSKSTKLECTLKVLLAPTESLVDTYRGLIPDGSAQDFNIILDLKGLTKNEKSTVLDQYNRDSRKNADTSDLVGKTMQETAKLMEKMKNTFTF